MTTELEYLRVKLRIGAFVAMHAKIRGDKEGIELGEEILDQATKELADQQVREGEGPLNGLRIIDEEFDKAEELTPLEARDLGLWLFENRSCDSGHK